MRWFVEVSRVGDNSTDEKYCVEAKQWQAALQEARKLRGDSGPLSKFSIELLDDGYRAVDPKQKLRFVVAKAPQDAQLSTESTATHLNGQASSASAPPVAAVSLAPGPVTPSLARSASVAAPPAAGSSVTAPAALTPPLSPVALSPAGGFPAPVVVAVPAPVASVPAPVASVPAPVASVPAPVVVAVPAPVASVPAPVAAAPTPLTPSPTAVAPLDPVHAEPYAGVPSSNLSPNASVNVAPAGGVHANHSPSAFPPRPATSPVGAPAAAATRPSTKPPGITVPADVIPAAPPLPQGLGPPVAPPQNFTQPSAAIDMPPPSSVLRKRQEEPTEESPITYREVAYVVDPGVSRGSVEALLWASFRDLSRELAGRPGQKFVQLAVFDHQFDKRPERAPLGTLAWKDWRGNPVITFPLFDGTAPARASMPAPSIKPIPVVKISSSAPPAPAASPLPAAAPPTVATAPVATVSSSSVAEVADVAPPTLTTPSALPSVEASPPPAVSTPPSSVVGIVAPSVVAAAASVEEAPAVTAQPPATSPLSAPVPVPVPVPVPTPEPSAPIPLTREKMPSHPSGPRGSRPRLAAVRRRAGEDLIGELFETMHDLHFMHGVADGAEFMLAAVDSIVPCDGVLIHVFDINTRQFVVVRAKGPGAMQALLHRTPDSQPFFNAIMRRPGSVAIHDVEKDPRILGPRWEALGVKPQRALCAPVRQGGRYLGLLEVVNPLGDAPFHQTEQNAIDYVCQQFAEFLVNRPIVLEADVILRR